MYSQQNRAEGAKQNLEGGGGALFSPRGALAWAKKIGRGPTWEGPYFKNREWNTGLDLTF